MKKQYFILNFLILNTNLTSFIVKFAKLTQLSESYTIFFMESRIVFYELSLQHALFY